MYEEKGDEREKSRGKECMENRRDRSESMNPKLIYGDNSGLNSSKRLLVLEVPMR